MRDGDGAGLVDGHGNLFPIKIGQVQVAIGHVPEQAHITGSGHTHHKVFEAGAPQGVGPHLTHHQHRHRKSLEEPFAHLTQTFFLVLFQIDAAVIKLLVFGGFLRLRRDGFQHPPLSVFGSDRGAIEGELVVTGDNPVQVSHGS